MTRSENFTFNSQFFHVPSTDGGRKQRKLNVSKSVNSAIFMHKMAKYFKPSGTRLCKNFQVLLQSLLRFKVEVCQSRYNLIMYECCFSVWNIYICIFKNALHYLLKVEALRNESLCVWRKFMHNYHLFQILIRSVWKLARTEKQNKSVSIISAFVFFLFEFINFILKLLIHWKFVKTFFYQWVFQRFVIHLSKNVLTD